jgi:hypothetical protein
VKVVNIVKVSISSPHFVAKTLFYERYNPTQPPLEKNFPTARPVRARRVVAVVDSPHPGWLGSWHRPFKINTRIGKTFIKGGGIT